MQTATTEIWLYKPTAFIDVGEVCAVQTPFVFSK